VNGDPVGPLDPRDYSRRTLLANERTYLAWWRTGLTTLTVALAAARVIPDLGHPAARWPYTALGVLFAVLGTICIVYAERRRRSVDRAVRQGGFADPDPRLTLLLTVGGTVAGVAMLVLIVLDG
jgi:putative membrane protein